MVTTAEAAPVAATATAAASGARTSEEQSPELFAAIRAIRAAIPHLKNSGGGSIVNLLNIGAKHPGPRSMPTSVTRAAGMAMTKALSKDPESRFATCSEFVRALWAVLPASILWGASFPLALAAVATDKEDPGLVVGGVYAANTVGAIIGSKTRPVR